MQSGRMQQPKNTVELDLRLAPASTSMDTGALLVSLMVCDVSHSIHLQAVQCGVKCPRPGDWQEELPWLALAFDKYQWKALGTAFCHLFHVTPARYESHQWDTQ